MLYLNAHEPTYLPVCPHLVVRTACQFMRITQRSLQSDSAECRPKAVSTGLSINTVQVPSYFSPFRARKGSVNTQPVYTILHTPTANMRPFLSLATFIYILLVTLIALSLAAPAPSADAATLEDAASMNDKIGPDDYFPEAYVP